MRSRSGITLVELMITVAMVGIVTAGLVMATHQLQLEGISELQRERAMLLLEYHASCLARDKPLDPAIKTRLHTDLPDASFSQETTDGVTTLRVGWRDPSGGPAFVTLAIFDKSGGR